MQKKVITLLLWLLVINLGISFGAGLYEAQVEGPQWLEQTNSGEYVWHADAAQEANSGVRFWVFITTVPLTLLTLVSGIFVWKAEKSTRKWWLLALAFIVIDRAMTFGYFIPTMVALTNGTIMPPEAAAVAQQWFSINHIRHTASGGALLLMLKTFSVHYSRTAADHKEY